MSDSKFFPSDRAEALTMLWLQNQDLSGKTPSEIQVMYYKAHQEIAINTVKDRHDGQAFAGAK